MQLGQIRPWAEPYNLFCLDLTEDTDKDDVSIHYWTQNVRRHRQIWRRNPRFESSSALVATASLQPPTNTNHCQQCYLPPSSSAPPPTTTVCHQHHQRAVIAQWKHAGLSIKRLWVHEDIRRRRQDDVRVQFVIYVSIRKHLQPFNLCCNAKYFGLLVI